MKIIKATILLLILPMIISCNNWLDVTPKAQVGVKKIFSTEDGYKDVLMGIYTSMIKESTYSRELSWGFVDALAQYYQTTSTSHIYYYAGKFDFQNSTTRSVIDDIWLNCYYTIANCNVLLDNLAKDDKKKFTNNSDKFIEAEAKAIRAFNHFNLLRLFAPNYSSEAYAIPYANKYRVEPFKQLKMMAFCDSLLNDLNDAYLILKEIDPIITKSEYKDPSMGDLYKYIQPIFDDDFYNYRGYRLNYFAVASLLSRVYLFMGNKDKAYTFAKEVLDNSDIFPFTPESKLSCSVTDRDANLQNEIIFALNDNRIYNKYLGSASSLYLSNVESIYPYPDDFRKRYLFSIDGEKYSTIKFNNGNNKLCMMRISELYLIAAECIYEKDPDLACNYINIIRKNRAINQEIKPSTYELFLKELVQEARREFFSEGQLFYMYKRLNMKLLYGNAELDITPEQMILPLPASEVEFGDYDLTMFN